MLISPGAVVNCFRKAEIFKGAQAGSIEDTERKLWTKTLTRMIVSMWIFMLVLLNLLQWLIKKSQPISEHQRRWFWKCGAKQAGWRGTSQENVIIRCCKCYRFGGGNLQKPLYWIFQKLDRISVQAMKQKHVNAS